MTHPLVESFRELVIDSFAVNLAGHPASLSYSEYVALASRDREGDEADVVDARFTTSLLGWLGWDQGDWRYNRPETGSGKNPQRPDFRVMAGGVTAFIVEDKASSYSWDPEYLEQMRKYAMGTIGYALWANARELHLLRFKGDGSYESLASSNVEGLYGAASVLDREREEIALLQIHALLSRDRFTSFAGLVEAACADDPRIALAEPAALAEFIAGSQSVLDEIARGAAAKIHAAVASTPVRRARQKDVTSELAEANAKLLEHAWSSTQADTLRTFVEGLIPKIGALHSSDLASPLAGTISASSRTAINEWLDAVLRIDTRWRLIDWEEKANVPIETAYELWTRQQPETATVELFADQVSYVLFVRLVLVRLLEDKGILPERIASDGGFEAWKNLIERHFTPHGATAIGDIHGDSFLAMLFRVVSSYYRHFFQQPIFDWYQPDDIALVRLLAHLNRYDFAEISDDVLGFTYEHYVDRRARNKKGQFLTRSEIVQYMLRQAGYEGRHVIGRRFLDHACGSGSFLIHAVRELRRALVDALTETTAATHEDLVSGDSEHRRSFSEDLLARVSRDFVGMDIDPFACYLAELNLLIQVLDEVTFLWSSGVEAPIDRFLIFNTDSLTLPESVLHSSLAATTLTSPEPNPLDESWEIKGRQGEYRSGFDYVLANPPYVTPKKQEVVRSAQVKPFFQDVLSQDPNYYLFFIRLAEYYLSDNGTAVLITPLNIVGDDSSEKARTLVTSGRCRLEAITRFYSGTVLFPSVDQWVVIFRFSAGDENRALPPISLRGGMSELDAQAEDVEVEGAKVLDIAPPPFTPTLSAPWASPWLHIAEETAFEVWDLVRQHSTGYVEHLLDAHVDARQGDVNTTAVSSLRRSSSGSQRLPIYGGKAAQPFAPLPPAKEWVQTPDEELTGDPGRTLYRLAHLEAREVGVIFQVQANLHIQRRLRATWFERDAESSEVFMHSLWRLVAKDGHETPAKAVLGFLSSALASYLFGMWSTNFNVQANTLRRLPIPRLDSFPEHELAAAADQALAARAAIEALIQGTSGTFAGGAVKLDRSAMLASSGVGTQTLHTAQLNGSLELQTGASMRVERILHEDRLSAAEDGYAEEVRLFLEPHKTRMWAQLAELRVPTPGALVGWREFYAAKEVDAAEAAAAYAASVDSCDAAVFDWYGFPQDEIRDQVRAGLPWEYRRARDRYSALTGAALPVDEITEANGDDAEAEGVPVET